MNKPNRFDYVRYDETANAQQAEAKKLFQAIETLVDGMGPGRYQSLAHTAAEEAYAWIGKAIRDHQIMRNGSAPLEEARGESNGLDYSKPTAEFAKDLPGGFPGNENP